MRPDHLGTSIGGIPRMREKQDDRISGGVRVHGCRRAWGVKGEPTTPGSSDLSSGTIKISEHSTCPHEISGGDGSRPTGCIHMHKHPGCGVNVDQRQRNLRFQISVIPTCQDQALCMF